MWWVQAETVRRTRHETVSFIHNFHEADGTTDNEDILSQIVDSFDSDMMSS